MELWVDCVRELTRWFLSQGWTSETLPTFGNGRVTHTFRVSKGTTVDPWIALGFVEMPIGGVDQFPWNALQWVKHHKMPKSAPRTRLVKCIVWYPYLQKKQIKCHAASCCVRSVGIFTSFKSGRVRVRLLDDRRRFVLCYGLPLNADVCKLIAYNVQQLAWL